MSRQNMHRRTLHKHPTAKEYGVSLKTADAAFPEENTRPNAGAANSGSGMSADKIPVTYANESAGRPGTKTGGNSHTAIILILVLAAAACVGIIYYLTHRGSDVPPKTYSSSVSESAKPGNSADSSSDDSGSTSTSGKAGETSTESGEWTLVEEGKLHVATDSDYPPYSSIGDDGEYVGIDIDLAREIADHLKLELVIDATNYEQVIPAVKSGGADLAISALQVSEERKELLDFTEPYIEIPTVAVVPKEGIASSGDADSLDAFLNMYPDLTIGYLEGSLSSSDLDKLQGFSAVASFEDSLSLIYGLISGELDCAFVSKEYAADFLNKYNNLEIVNGSEGWFDMETSYSIGVAKNNPALLKAVSDVLADLKEDGTMQSIIGRYL